MSNLIWLFITPFIASALTLLAFPLTGKKLKTFAITLSLFPLIILLFGHATWVNSNVDFRWIPTLSIHFHLSVDNLSLLFLGLTSIVIPMSLLSVRTTGLISQHTFYALVLILQGLLIGFFTAKDLALFTVFWEAMLLPLYFIINLWGGSQRQAVSLKFLIYMIAGSALMVAAVLFLYFATMKAGHGTFNLDALPSIALTIPYAKWICLIFLIAFSVKTPLFPFHAWLPDTYCQASTPGTILLSAILSKAGIYGIIRISLGIFPALMKEWSPLLLDFAIVGVLYGGLAAWMQKDYKRLLAYSSFSHVNFVLAGLFVWNQTAHEGAILQALNHGVTITALFLVAGWLEERLHSTAIGPASGCAEFLPKLCWLTLFFVLSSIALPGLNNFVGELLILFGLFNENPWLAAVLGLSVILSVIYMLRWMQKVYFEQPTPFQKSWIDIKTKEIVIALPLIALILWVGIYPSPLLNFIKPTAEKSLVK